MIAWLALAHARKPVPDPAPDPAASAKVEEDRACAADVPENYQIHTGYASGEGEAEAIAAALADARARALSTLCSGKSPTRCEILARHVEAWKLPYWNPVTHRSCAHVGVRRDFLDDDQGDQRRLSAEIARLGGDVAAKVGTTPVWIDPPTWTGSGCHAGPAGSAMVAELRNALATAGTVRIATASDAATTVHLALDVRAAEVVVSAHLREKGKPGVLPLVGFTVAGDLFDLHEAGDDCWFDRELGLEAGQRPGRDGRVVRISLPGEGSYCEGDSIQPQLVVDRPSVVKVFSVARDGTAFLVWPPPGSDGRVASAVSLGDMALVRSTVPGDEKLVAFAVAAGASAGATQSWTAFCRTPSALSASLWPADAAVGAATFEVLAADAPSCVQRRVRPLAPAGIPDAPVCR